MAVCVCVYIKCKYNAIFHLCSIIVAVLVEKRTTIGPTPTHSVRVHSFCVCLVLYVPHIVTIKEDTYRSYPVCVCVPVQMGKQ